MRIFMTGGTGLLGSRLVPHLLQAGHELQLLSRRPQPGFPPGCAAILGDPCQPGPWLESVAGCDAVIHLAGASLFERRWRRNFKNLIRASRVESTLLLARKLADSPWRANGQPRNFLTASATGYYGTDSLQEFDENSPPGGDFLAGVCRDWEQATQPAQAAGVRVTHARLGLILDHTQGGLPRLGRPFYWFLGATLGDGRQWVSWIHIEDACRGILHCLNEQHPAGPYNLTAPEPVTNWGLSKAIASAIRRPCWFTVPGWVLRLALGEAASLLLQGQKVLPRKLVATGFDFQFADVSNALKNLLHRAGSNQAQG